ncbi:MAG: hypothetical protein WCI66_10540 [Gammaproteobacteria bacterium]|jgi:hypothetical protein
MPATVHKLPLISSTPLLVARNSPYIVYAGAIRDKDGKLLFARAADGGQ